MIFLQCYCTSTFRAGENKTCVICTVKIRLNMAFELKIILV